MPEAFEQAAAQSAEYRRLLDLGCAWLDQQAGFFGEKAFGALGENQRARLVLFASEQAPGSVPRVFFETTQAHAFRLFWARPEAWAAIGYGGPPQPAGFTDYAEPPDDVMARGTEPDVVVIGSGAGRRRRRLGACPRGRRGDGAGGRAGLRLLERLPARPAGLGAEPVPA